MQKRAFDLMRIWCDTLLSYRVSSPHKSLDGALLCPACHVVHGRIADLCFPLTLLWARTGEARYLEAAEQLVDWTERELRTPDGLWYNDAGNRWIGTSAFSAMALGEALEQFGDALPEKLRERWMAIFVRISDAILTLDSRPGFRPVINYYCGIACELAMAWKLTGEEKYLEKSAKWESAAIVHFDTDGLLFGEGGALDYISERGTHHIDMGYNLEESLPLLLRLSAITGKNREFYRDRLRDHLAFLLPDGGIDNSFGSRHNKWTYWGSRTSDGLLEGLALVLDDPMLANACERVLSLYEKSTHDGLLSLPMAHEAGEPTCLHHSFCHAKALAALALSKPVETKPAKLPCEEKRGVRLYQNGCLAVVSHGVWRATLSALESAYPGFRTHCGGGSLNLLRHDTYGVICAATTAAYQPTEPLNQQYPRSQAEIPCMSAQFIVDGRDAAQHDIVRFDTIDTNVTASCERWRAEYSFGETALSITLGCENGVFSLPVVCSKSTDVTVSDDGCRVNFGTMMLTSSAPMRLDPAKRSYHPVGGFLYLPITIPVRGEVRLTLA